MPPLPPSAVETPPPPSVPPSSHSAAPAVADLLIVGADSAIAAEVHPPEAAGPWRRIGTSRRLAEPQRGAPGWDWLLPFDADRPDAAERLSGALDACGISPSALVFLLGRPVDKPFLHCTAADLAAGFEVNFAAAFRVAQVAARRMMVAGGGRIVFVGSVSGLLGNPGQAVYGSMKAALGGLTRTLAAELGPYRISVNLVAPGLVRSKMSAALPPAVVQRAAARTPLRRLAEPAEVGAAIRALLGPGGAFISGQTIAVDGGLSSA